MPPSASDLIALLQAIDSATERHRLAYQQSVVARAAELAALQQLNIAQRAYIRALGPVPVEAA